MMVEENKEVVVRESSIKGEIKMMRPVAITYPLTTFKYPADASVSQNIL